MHSLKGAGLFYISQIFMIRCNKCNLEKEDNNFQTYWHSTQQKHRTRKTCTECYYNQRNERKRLKRTKILKLIEEPIPTKIIPPQVPELEPEVFENNPEYKKCRKCEKYKPLTEYYLNPKGKSLFLDCKPCTLEKYRESDRIKREAVLIEQGGSSRHFEAPNEYVDEYQKEATFNLLKLMGWSFNEENQIWWKDGIKTKDGLFINVKPYKVKRSGAYFSRKKTLMPRIVDLRENKKMSYDTIALKLNVGHNTVYNWYQDYLKEKE